MEYIETSDQSSLQTEDVLVASCFIEGRMYSLFTHSAAVTLTHTVQCLAIAVRVDVAQA